MASEDLILRVIDALDAPHGGRILRLRVVEGKPTVSAIKGARFRAVSQDGEEERTVRVTGFALMGGKPRDERLARTGRVDVVVVDEGQGSPVVIGWQLAGPI